MIAWWWKETSKKNETVEETVDEESESTSRTTIKPGPRRTRAKKLFSRNRFANLVRKNSVSLKTKGNVDSLVHHLGDTITENKNIPLFVRNGSLMDKYIESIQSDIQNIFLKHSNDLIEQNNTAAREKSSKIIAELEASLQVCRDSVRHRKCQVESFAEQRKEVLQFNRTNLFEHQEAMTDCVNDIKVRKDEVIEEQDSLLAKLDEIVPKR